MSREFSRAFYHSPLWQDVRMSVLMRDNFLCMKCGNPAEEVHHIVHLRPDNIADPNISINPDNLISLCKDCHLREHIQDKARGHIKADKQGILQEYTFDKDGNIIPIEAHPPGCS